MLNRRNFLTSSLRRSTLLALAPAVPTFVERTARAAKADRDDRVLVVVELAGGNDGLNTVVPFRDDSYTRARPTLGLPADQLLRLCDDLGLNPAMRGMARLWEAGALAIVQGVGYPNPNRSHFESLAIWHTARPEGVPRGSLGWIGQGLDAGPRATDGGATALFVGEGSPSVALRGRRSMSASFDRPEDLRLEAAPAPLDPTAGDSELDAFVKRSLLDSYATSDRLGDLMTPAGDRGAGYPATALGRRLRMIAGLIRGGLGSRVYYTLQSGYDTHALQLTPHNTLLGVLSDALWAFHGDLSSAGLADRVVVLCFSEFGRRVAENGGRGTDHGTAGPVLLVGTRVRPGLSGETPNLSNLEDGDLKWTIDFRRVYASVLENWLGLPSAAALGGTFMPVPVLRS